MERGYLLAAVQHMPPLLPRTLKGAFGASEGGAGEVGARREGAGHRSRRKEWEPVPLPGNQRPASLRSPRASIILLSLGRAGPAWTASTAGSRMNGASLRRGGEEAKTGGSGAGWVRSCAPPPRAAAGRGCGGRAFGPGRDSQPGGRVPSRRQRRRRARARRHGVAGREGAGGGEGTVWNHFR